MSFNFPEPTEQTSYLEIPADYQAALDKALTQLEAESSSGGWEDAGDKEEVKLYKKTNPDNPADIPTVKGITTVEGITPTQVLAAVQLPGFRKKWDPRFESGYPLERYDAQTYLFYSVMKSPSYFVWARDVLGVQQNQINKDGDEIIVLQTSVDADKYVSEAASYSKSRTRATLEVSGWKLTKEGDNTKVEYLVKIHLNGALPTSVVSMVATETPMCVGRVRDTLYTYGYTPHSVATKDKTILLHAEFEDGDGSEAKSGAKSWTGKYRGNGEDVFSIAFDKNRMYPSGVSVSTSEEAASSITTEVDNEAGIVKVTVGEAANGKKFFVTIKPQ